MEGTWTGTLLHAFIAGGLICMIGQLFMDLTKPGVTPGHILVGYITSGAFLSAVGLYEPLLQWAGAGASIPLSGFGHSLAQGAIEGVASRGFVGIFSGGLEATAAGITAAIVFGYLISLTCEPRG